MNQEETPSFPEAEVLKTLGEIEEQLNVQYAPFQQEAIQTALHKTDDVIDRWTRNRENNSY